MHGIQSRMTRVRRYMMVVRLSDNRYSSARMAVQTVRLMYTTNEESVYEYVSYKY